MIFDSPDSGRFAYVAQGGGLPDENGSGTFQAGGANVFAGGSLIGSLPSCDRWTFRISGLVLDDSTISRNVVLNNVGLIGAETITGVNFQKIRNYTYDIVGRVIGETSSLTVGALSCDYNATITWNDLGDIIAVQLSATGTLLNPPSQSITFVQRFGQFGQCIPY